MSIAEKKPETLLKAR